MSNSNPIILIVDDNPTNLGVLFDFFKDTEYEISSAKNGKNALEVIEIEPPELILLDILMPEMDGFEVCRRLKADDKTQDIPIIFMTALSDTVDKVKGFELGAVDYITKPFECEEVLARVKTHLTLQRLQNQLADKNQELRSKNSELEDALAREKELLDRERRLAEDLRINLSVSLPHELRTPLAGIIGSSELLLDPDLMPEKELIVKLADSIRGCGLRLQRLVENYLLYANLKLVKYTKHHKPEWEHHISVETEGFIRSLAPKKAAEEDREGDLVLELVDTEIKISPENFRKIIIELLDNAFKFSQKGSHVRLKTAVEEGNFILSITNSGRGMTPDQISKIDAFMQFDRNRQEQQGSGLGLIISRLLTQLEGGEFDINSEKGNYTTVSVVLKREI